VLRAVVLTFDHQAGGQVGDAHRGIGLVDVLAAGAGGPVGVDAQVGRVDVDLADLVGFRHYRHGAGRGVDAALRFGFRNALHAVAARFELQPRIRAVADDAHDDFLVAADLAGVFRHDFHLPATALGVACVHAQEVAGEQRGLVAAGAGADFEENVALVVGVFRQERGLQRRFQVRDFRFAVGQLGLGQFAQFRIGEHFAGRFLVRFNLPILAIQRHHRGEIGMFAGELAVAVHVASDFRLRQQGVEFLQPLVGASELVRQRGFHS